MQKVSIREVRQRIGQLITAVSTGDNIIITRRGKPVAKLVAINTHDKDELSFPDREEFRSNLPLSKKISAQLIREIRDERV